MDNRQELNRGSIIIHGSIRFEITGLLGKGGSSIAYTAQYRDSLVEGGIHKCIIKELFPYHPGGTIRRAKNGEIQFPPELRSFYDAHTERFIRGSRLHLHMLDSSPDSVGAYFDSFRYNKTIYSVLGINSIETLSAGHCSLNSLKDITVFIIKLLKAVNVFHKNGLLHLDISPDNIIISDSNGEDRVLLIDFNSCMSARRTENGYISFNSNYSATELRLGSIGCISEAADVFSVCAVFAHLIDGKSIRAAARLRRLTGSAVLKDVPQPAVSLLLAILSSGLRSDPRLRCGSAEKMIKLCDELIKRIDNTGVTHASLWETSRRTSSAPPENLIRSSITVHGSIYCSDRIISLGNTVLTGAGGIGKTTLYKHLAYINTRVYDPSVPVYFYVPLYRYDGMTDFIKRYIVSKTKFDKALPTVADAIKHLNELMDENSQFIALLLDGLNETRDDCGELIKEIEELAEKKGVTVSISERTGSRTDGLFNDFARASLMPPDEGSVREYLALSGVPYPDDERTAKLLSNPLMLSLYAKAENVFKECDSAPFSPSTSSDIIHGYIECLAESFRRASPGSGSLRLRFTYVTEILLPELCARSAKEGPIDYGTARSICKKAMKRLRGRTFSSVFTKYAGKSAAILGGAANADEWTDTAFLQILVSETALFTDNDGVYLPMHSELAECLAEDHAKNMRLYRRAFIGTRIPSAALGISLCLISAQFVYFRLPGTHPIGKRETRDNYTIMATVAHSLNNITQMVLAEENLIQAIDNGSARNALEELRAADEKLNTIGDAAVSANELDELAYRGLDMDTVKKLIDRSAEHRRFQTAMFDRLELALPLYSEEKLHRELELYSEYLDSLEKLVGYEICLLTKTINSKGGGVIKEAMTGNGDIVLSFNAALEIDRNDLENSIKSLELKLAELASGLGYVQGE